MHFFSNFICFVIVWFHELLSDGSDTYVSVIYINSRQTTRQSKQPAKAQTDIQNRNTPD